MSSYVGLTLGTNYKRLLKLTIIGRKSEGVKQRKKKKKKRGKREEKVTSASVCVTKCRASSRHLLLLKYVWSLSTYFWSG